MYTFCPMCTLHPRCPHSPFHTSPPLLPPHSYAFCEDCLPEEHEMVGECDHFKAMGQVWGEGGGRNCC